MGFARRLIPKTLVSWYHLVWAFVAATRYGFPARKLTVVGVTGTNGKSSTVYLLTRILEEGGVKVASASSIEFQVGKRRWTNAFKMTMPGRGFLQKLLADAVRAGCTHAVLEVTSEGILQYRHRFVDFRVAVFLNLSPEHIERHGSYEAYRAAKSELFRALGSEAGNGQPTTAVVNLADKEASYFLRVHADRFVGFRTAERAATAALPAGGVEVVARNTSATPEGIRFSLGDAVFDSPLRGAFHIENALAAVSTAATLGVPMTACATALRRIRNIPGRFEEISMGNGPAVVVDYAHTPEALRSVYTAAKQHWAHLVCVLGATGGGRDKWKRAVLGKLAAEYCDSLVVADEDPYDEDPAEIRRGVMDGAIAAGAESRIREIPDRRLAIREALAKAAPGGAVVVTGKGSEPWMVVAKGKKILWDDRKIAKEELALFTHEG